MDVWRQIESLYEDARDLSSEEQEAFLKSKCDDEVVRAEVASLLAARREAPDFFEDLSEEGIGPVVNEIGARGDEGGRSGALDLAGREVGGYRLRGEIGVGGMSVVYRAERADADFQQTVAVKLLQRFQSSDVEQRFRAERQVLASLDHPNIAGLVDGGVTDGGRPYLVMEHVDGQPIAEYVEEQDLGLDSRLDLLEQVVKAVSAAHRQLVVHRDLKSANVLVTETESGPTVKLLDFGIAKLLDNSFPVTRPQTRTKQYLMTPAYAAPEQVKGDEIGAATDVYQLGVLIYEVLTGTRPFDLEDKSFTEVERILMEEAPPAPSEQRLNDTEVEAGELRGDLDTIVLKALRKEPERRYRSVEALGADLRRYRGREPIEARPATFAYRTRKFVNRNQVTVGAGLMIALLVMTYAATVTVQADRLAEQRDRARTEAETARQVSGVLVDLFRNANPYENTDTLTARSLLRRGERRMSRLQDRPAVQAKLLGAMGRAYRGLGNYGRADSLLQRALSLRSRLYEAPHPELAKSLYHLGRIQHEQRRYALAESLHTEALAMRRRMYDAPHRRIAESLHRRAATFEEQERYAAADSIFRHALSMYRSVFEGPHPKVAAALNDFGLALVGRGQYARADSVYRIALSIRRSVLDTPHPKVASTLNDLAVALNERKQYAAADSVYRDALAIKRKTLRPTHPSLAVTLYNMALNQEEQGRYAAADSLFRSALSIERRTLGPTDPSTGVTRISLAEVKERRGRYSKAASLYRKAVSVREQSYGAQDPRTAESISDLASVLMRQGELSAAEAKYRRSLAIRRAGSADSSKIATTLNNLGLVLKEQGNLAAADSLYQKSLSIKRSVLPPRHQRTTLHNRAYVVMKQGRYALADSLFREALAMRRAEDGARSADVAQTQAGRALLACQRGNYRKAEHLARTALTIRREQFRAGHPRVQESLQDLLKIYREWNRPQQAADYRQRLATRSGTPREE